MTEVLKAARVLVNAATVFKTPSKTQPIINAKAAIKCLYAALSLVVPPSFELEIRLALGELLLQHSTQPLFAVEQFQKAFSLCQNVKQTVLTSHMHMNACRWIVGTMSSLGHSLA